MNYPRILVPLPAYNATVPPKYGVNQSYVEAVVRGGGEPLCIVRPDDGRLRLLLPLVDGVLIVGGHDIDSEYYGEENTEHTQNIDRDRDRLELALICLAVKHRLPLLGICRGMQAINVALGGSLYQDVLTEMPGALFHDHHKDSVTGKELPHSTIVHDVFLKEKTLLHGLVGRATIAVNSLHHQGVKMLGKGLIPSALAPDGLIEAIELPNPPFFLGVEWHPEELTDEASQKIFSAFIKATAKKG